MTLKLLRYTKGDFFKKLVTSGDIRISSVSKYRKSDGLQVGDKIDGILPWSAHFDRLTQTDLSEHPHVRRIFGGIDPRCNVKDITIKNCRITSEPLFVYSCSYRYCDRMHLSWKSEQQYDVCFQITDAMAFAEIITEELNKRINVNFLGFGAVTYANYSETAPLRVDHPALRLPPYLVKQRRYRRQLEIRLIWAPRNRTISLPDYLDLTNPSLSGLCRLFRTL